LAAIKSEIAEHMGRVKLLVIHDRKADDVATAVGMTENAVYIAHNRVRTRLRQVIDEFLN
jgi:DNA-directed RNA polymerase specialized sigma24 family protein